MQPANLYDTLIRFPWALPELPESVKSVRQPASSEKNVDARDTRQVTDDRKDAPHE